MVRAGALALSGGRLGDVGDTLVDIERLLSRSLKDWAVTESDCAQVHALLERLPAATYREVLEGMERRGLLERYVDALSPEGRWAFVLQGEARGLHTRASARPPPDAPGAPPAEPRMFRVPPDVPETLQALLCETNAAQARDYGARYEGYLERYVALVEKARSPADVRALGEVVSPSTLLVSGSREPSRSAAYEALRRKADELRELQSAGTLSSELSLKHSSKVGVEGASVQLATELAVKATPGRGLSASEKLEAVFELGSWKGSVSFGGTTPGPRFELTRTLGAGLGIGVLGDERGVRDGALKVEGAGAKLAVDTSGRMTTELSITPALSVMSAVSPQDGTLEAGVKAAFGADVSKTEVSLGVLYQGARASSAERIAHGHGFFGALPELEARTSWNVIPPARRQALFDAEGWTEKRWTEALARLRPRR